MAALTRSKSGAYAARKGIPKDVQDEYERLYGYRWEAKLTLPAALKPAEAKAQYGEWLAEIETRIETIRSHRNGGGQALSQKQASVLRHPWEAWGPWARFAAKLSHAALLRLRRRRSFSCPS